MSSLWHAWTHGPSHQFSVSNQLRWRLNRRASHSGATRNIFHTLTGFCSVNHPDAWNSIDSFSARGAGRIIQRLHWSELLTEDMQKAWFGLCWELWKWLPPRFQPLFKHLQSCNTLFGSHGRYLNQEQSCVVKYLLINSLWRNSQQKTH